MSSTKGRKYVYWFVDMRTNDILAKENHGVTTDVSKLRTGGVYWFRDTSGNEIPVQVRPLKERVLVKQEHQKAGIEVSDFAPFDNTFSVEPTNRWLVNRKELDILTAIELLEEFENDPEKIRWKILNGQM